MTMDSSNETKAFGAGFEDGRASRGAEVAALEVRMAELEAVIKEALNAITTRGTVDQALDVVHAILHSKPPLILADRDRENRAIGWDEAADVVAEAWDTHQPTPSNPYREGDVT